MVKILYFARLREAFGTGSEDVPLPAGIRTASDLAGWLRERGEPWRTELAPSRPVRMAVNQEMADGEYPVNDGDEVAFFPPVTGG